jgi:HAD superfamily hydrolase (TIGR01509 family)
MVSATKPRTKFQAAIFDLDGTVTDSSLLHWQTFNEVLKPYNVQIDKETWLHVYEGTGAQHIFEDVLARHGLMNKVDAAALRLKRHNLFTKLAQEQLLAVKGFGQFYDQLKALAVPSIIATNGDDQNVLLSLQLLKMEDEPRVTSAEAGKVKPDPAVYNLACKRLGLQPARCVIFEDSVPGVLAAKRAGCYCVCVLTTTTRKALEEAGADLVVQDYMHLSAGLLFEKKTKLV